MGREAKRKKLANIRMQATCRSQYLRRLCSQKRIPKPGFQNFRCVHQLRQLPYDIEQGLGDFLTPKGLRLIAVDFQQGLLTRLNEQLRGWVCPFLQRSENVKPEVWFRDGFSYQKCCRCGHCYRIRSKSSPRV